MNGGLPGPRDWIGSAPFPWPPAHAVAVGELFHACFYLVSVHALRTKTDKPYLRLQLQDMHGTLEARVWEMAEQIAASLRDGIYIGVRGRIEVFNGERQLKVEEVAQIRVGLDDLEHFLPRSPRDPDAMERELAGWIVSVSDEPLRRLLEHLLGAGSAIGAGFRLAPAAKFNHHAYLGGLIEHTLSIVSVCDMLAAHYQPHVDRDLLIAGALLHDIGKVREIGARAGFPYTDEGKLLGHIVLGMQMIAEAAQSVPALSPQRLTLLQHLVASHQGRYEWQSPREPRTLEAYILHYADDLDAKMQHAIRLVGHVSAAAGWSGYDRSLGREMYRHMGGDDEAGAAGATARSEREPGAGGVAGGSESGARDAAAGESESAASSAARDSGAATAETATAPNERNGGIDRPEPDVSHESEQARVARTKPLAPPPPPEPVQELTESHDAAIRSDEDEEERPDPAGTLDLFG